MFTEPNALISRVADQLSVELDGEIAILNLKSKKYFGLTDVGAFIWELLGTPTDIAALAEAVSEQFEVSTAQATVDAESFLQNLDQNKLLRIDQQDKSEHQV